MSSIKKNIYGEKEKNVILKSTLYLVATPIGNLADISERALKTLREVDFIAAEDTRNTVRLLTHFGIQKELVSYFEHNKRERGELICRRIEAGETCALVTDAGMPAISDPGEDIVRLCSEKNIPVKIVPGACAAVSALALSALSTGRFAFEGFLSANKGERKKRLAEIKGERRTLIFYEAPHKLETTLKDLSAVFGEERKISMCREITKINEEVVRTTLSGALEMCSAVSPRGEYVLVLEGADEAGIPHSEKDNDYPQDPREHVAMYIKSGLARMDAIKAAAKDRGVPKSVLYRMLENNPEE